MIVPGVPPLGVQQEVFKPERQTKTTATAAVPDEALSELPVEERQQQHQQHKDHADHEALPHDEQTSVAEQLAAEDTAEHERRSVDAELPRKGLLVDIRA